MNELKDAQEIFGSDGIINVVKIYYIKSTVIYNDNTEQIINSDMFYSSYKMAEETLNFLNNDFKNPSYVKSVNREIKSTYLECKVPLY